MRERERGRQSLQRKLRLNVAQAVAQAAASVREQELALATLAQHLEKTEVLTLLALPVQKYKC